MNKCHIVRCSILYYFQIQYHKHLYRNDICLYVEKNRHWVWKIIIYLFHFYRAVNIYIIFQLPFFLSCILLEQEKNANNLINQFKIYSRLTLYLFSCKKKERRRSNGCIKNKKSNSNNNWNIWRKTKRKWIQNI